MKRKMAKTGRDLDPLEDESHEERKLSLTSHSLARERGSVGSRKHSTEEKKKSKFSSQRHGSGGEFQVQPS